MRRIVETDCAFTATKHFSSRVINGIARYFMRLLLRACSQTDTEHFIPNAVRRIRLIKYRSSLCARARAGGKYLLFSAKSTDGWQKSVNVASLTCISRHWLVAFPNYPLLSGYKKSANPRERKSAGEKNGERERERVRSRSSHKNLLRHTVAKRCNREREERKAVRKLLVWSKQITLQVTKYATLVEMPAGIFV